MLRCTVISAAVVASGAFTLPANIGRRELLASGAALFTTGAAGVGAANAAQLGGIASTYEPSFRVANQDAIGVSRVKKLSKNGSDPGAKGPDSRAQQKLSYTYEQCKDVTCSNLKKKKAAAPPPEA